MKRFRQIVCKVIERHPVTHEPFQLEVLPRESEVDLRDHNDFVVLLGGDKSFQLFGSKEVYRLETPQQKKRKRRKDR